MRHGTLAFAAAQHTALRCGRDLLNKFSYAVPASGRLTYAVVSAQVTLGASFYMLYRLYLSFISCRTCKRTGTNNGADMPNAHAAFAALHAPPGLRQKNGTSPVHTAGYIFERGRLYQRRPGSPTRMAKRCNTFAEKHTYIHYLSLAGATARTLRTVRYLAQHAPAPTHTGRHCRCLDRPVTMNRALASPSV